MRNYDRIILGKGYEYSGDGMETMLNGNVIVCGGSGSGKTRSVAEARMLETLNGSLVVTLSKRRLVKEYMQLFRDRGYRVLALNLSEPEQSSVFFDPMKGLEDNDAIRSFCEMMSETFESKVDSFWQNAASSMLAAEICCVRDSAYLKSLGAVQPAQEDGLRMPVSAEMLPVPGPEAEGKIPMPDTVSFTDVLKLNASLRFGAEGVQRSQDTRFRWIAARLKDDFMAQSWNTFAVSPDKTARNIYSTLTGALSRVFPDSVSRAMGSVPAVDLRSIAREKTVLFITNPAVDPAKNTFVGFLYRQLFRELFEFAEEQEDGRLPVPVHVLCDDFATGVPIRDFAEYISIFREKDISVTMLLQSETQLADLYGDRRAATIINNCDTYVYLGGMDVATAMAVSRRANRPLDELLNLQVGREWLFRRGQKPVHTERYDIRENEHYAEFLRAKEREIS